ncbi:MAG TPA: hypothetical protein VLE21_06540 [Candidatus Nitrosocosmicus sp.]|nr:hypothetical protein [Candidatus Nitrosocosmicus sp.]
MIIIPKQKKYQQPEAVSSLCTNCKKSYGLDESSYDASSHRFVCPNCGK